MKNSAIVLTSLLLGLSPLFADSGAPGNLANPTLLLQTNYTVPYGPLVYGPKHNLNGAAVNTTYIQATLTGPGCGASLVRAYATSLPSETQMLELESLGNGIYKLFGPNIYWLSFDLSESAYYPSGSCALTVVAGEAPNTGSTNETLAGVIHIAGGYQPKLQLAVSPTVPVESFRFDIPAFCQNIQILEAGTVTDNIYTASPPVTGAASTYSVNGGAGEHITNVTLSVNAPSGSSCDIPVYLSYTTRIENGK